MLKRTVGGYIVVQGRADDTMNLGGIKVSILLILSFVGLPFHSSLSHVLSFADELS